jgi:site-specific recombinase XerD
MSEDSLLERVTAAANERQLSQNTLTAYRRTWLKLIAWAAAQGLALETLPSDRAGEFYEEAIRGRSASHHLQIKAALSLLYHVLSSSNPFAECQAPKFAPEKAELGYHTASQLGQLLRELRADTAAATSDISFITWRRALLHRLPVSRVGTALSNNINRTTLF